MFKIEDFAPTKSDAHGVVANFSVRFPTHSICELALVRHIDDAGKVFVRPPKGRRSARPVAVFDAALFKDIAERVTAVYNAATGDELVFGRAQVQFRPDAAPENTDEPESATDSATGLRRVLRADVAECVQAAGLN